MQASFYLPSIGFNIEPLIGSKYDSAFATLFMAKLILSKNVKVVKA